MSKQNKEPIKIKFSTAIIFLVIVVLIFGGVITYLIISSKNGDSVKNIQTNSNNISVNQTDNSATTNNTITNSTKTKNITTNSTTTTKKRYTYGAIALQGCVIESVDSKTGMCTYKEKCEKCGTVQPGGKSINVGGNGTITNSAFMCVKCKNNQTVKIEETAKYE